MVEPDQQGCEDRNECEGAKRSKPGNQRGD